MHISRRFIKKSGAAPPGGEELEGYKSIGELCTDLEGLINIVWLSGTRTWPTNHLCPTMHDDWAPR